MTCSLWIHADSPVPASKADGYRGIWFSLGQFSEYGDKYSGGLGSYTAKHRPLAVYSPEAKKTFFVYGGTTSAEERHLLIMVSCYDHESGTVPRPTVVHDKEGVNDPHDNGSILLDEEGHVWVFVSGRGRKRMGFKYRSVAPFSIDRFECVEEKEMTYPQPWLVKGQGIFHFLTRYTKGRELYWESSGDGRQWSEVHKLAGMGGHYQVSAEGHGRVITAFNYHPGGNVDKRTNLYYVESDDMGASWKTAGGEKLVTPLEAVDSPALVHDYAAEDRLVYVKDICFDEAGHPVILIITSADYRPGPEGDPRIWTLVRWNGDDWEFMEITRSTHNYDMGSLYVEENHLWRLIAPTEAGPQPFGTGGEIALWLSRDGGRHWSKERDITKNSVYNHAYARKPLNADPAFYAFWADGNPDSFSPSQFYFTNQEGTELRVLPDRMDGEEAVPLLLD
ncbi:MAG: hypothetical protein GX130_06695 [Candidatus Hydrogenedens sp.]|nr:hypothetical protein [Candidatus Hydrogenedens sp.]